MPWQCHEGYAHRVKTMSGSDPSRQNPASHGEALRKGQEVRVLVVHEERTVWCRIDNVRPGEWYDVTPIDPADSNVVMVHRDVVLEARDASSRVDA